MILSRQFVCRKSSGFTLAELAIVLVIIGLLLTSLMPPLTAQVDLRQYSETEQTLHSVKDALVAYAMTHAATDGRPYLPCPAADDTGVEATRVSGACPVNEGRLPWIALGIGQTDAWTNRFRYKVNPSFSNNTTGFSFASSGTLRVCEDSACAKILANQLPVVLVSHGKNGAGAFNSNGGANPDPEAANTDERANANTDVVNDDYVARTPATNFDDIVVWLPTPVLISKMVSAGRLP